MASADSATYLNAATFALLAPGLSISHYALRAHAFIVALLPTDLRKRLRPKHHLYPYLGV